MVKAEVNLPMPQDTTTSPDKQSSSTDSDEEQKDFFERGLAHLEK